MKKTIINIIITFIFAVIVYYFALPAINITNPGFYAYMGFIIIFYAFLDAIVNCNNPKIELLSKDNKIKDIQVPKAFKYCFISIIITIATIILVNFICSPLFNAKSYQRRITVYEDGVFETDIPEVNFNQIPLLDKASSQVLGDRVMGQMSDLVSQYSVSDMYTQINYNDSIMRVTPLEYADTIKWFTNRKNGIAGYITVNSVTGESNLVRLDKGMKYSPSAKFNENLKRKLRFSYPTLNFGKISFEIDNEGNPYYIVPIIKYTAVGLKARVNGVIIFNPITGESNKYNNEDIPTWVDIAYSADLIIEQVDDWGTYKNGFFNSLFGQKNVVNTTDGYNYLAMNDDIYLYTGITSIVSDESNLGFILTNMRTGNTKYYVVPGAEEYSAMSSAEGQVQDMGYTSTFPLLINLDGQPTYLVSLKDSNGLVKMYGFIDVKDYQKVTVTDSSLGITKARDNYLASIKKEVVDEELTITDITINEINSAIINGNTNYFITSGDDRKYQVSITLSNKLAFLKKGDIITIGYYQTDDEIIKVEKVY